MVSVARAYANENAPYPLPITYRLSRLAGSVPVRIRPGRSLRPDLPGEAGTARVPVSAGFVRGLHEPSFRTGAGRVARAAIRRRQPSGRRRQYRRGAGCAGGARRLYAAHGPGVAGDERGALQEAHLPPRARFPSGRAADQLTARAGRAADASREERQGARRAGESEAGPAYLCLDRRGQLFSPDDGVVPAEHRDRLYTRAVQRL